MIILLMIYFLREVYFNMKKILILLLGFVFILFLSSCDKSVTTLETTSLTTNIITANIISTSQSSLTTTTTMKITTLPTLSTTEGTTENLPTTDYFSLKNEELPIHSSYYGNTNGNSNNQGFVVYDTINKLHYYALGAMVYSYNPGNEETSLLFSLNDGGNVKNLCLTDTHLYFVSTKDYWIMRYDFSTKEITTISELETHMISRYDNYIYFDAVNPDYYGQEVRGIKIYKHNTETFLTDFGTGISSLNISGTKILYLQDFGTRIQLASSNFIGKTTEANFDDQEFEEIIEMHMIKDDYIDGRSYAFIANTSSITALYFYNANSGLIQLASGNDIHSLNSDDSNLYFINSGAIYSYNLFTMNTFKICDVYTNSKYINVINYWIYFSDDNSANLYRIDPDTLEIEALN